MNDIFKLIHDIIGALLPWFLFFFLFVLGSFVIANPEFLFIALIAISLFLKSTGYKDHD